METNTKNQESQTNSETCLQQCSKTKCYCKNKSCDYAYKQYGMKRWVYGIIITVISLGLIVPFLSEALLTVWFPEVSLGLNTWNQFVSIILGIVATILSIVSLIMGFKNYEDGLDLHERHVQSLEKITLISKDVNDVKGKLDNFSMLADARNEALKIPPKKVWGNEPKDVII